MQVLSVRPVRGLRWVIDGFRLLLRQPLPLLACVFLFLILITLPTILPSVGGFLPLLLTPIFSLGLMKALAAVERGERPLPQHLFAGFRDDGGSARTRLLLLGVVNTLATTLALLATTIADGGTLMRIVTGAIEKHDPGLRDATLLFAAAIFLVLYTPVQMSLWFAPMFVAWHRQPVAKSLFFSVVALWRNKWPFLLYGLGWFAVVLVSSILVQLLVMVFGAQKFWLPLLLSPLSLIMVTAIYASVWATYRDSVE